MQIISIRNHDMVCIVELSKICPKCNHSFLLFTYWEAVVPGHWLRRQKHKQRLNSTMNSCIVLKRYLKKMQQYMYSCNSIRYPLLDRPLKNAHLNNYFFRSWWAYWEALLGKVSWTKHLEFIRECQALHFHQNSAKSLEFFRMSREILWWKDF